MSITRDGHAQVGQLAHTTNRDCVERMRSRGDGSNGLVDTEDADYRQSGESFVQCKNGYDLHVGIRTRVVFGWMAASSGHHSWSGVLH
jgi:hypothetical protein